MANNELELSIVEKVRKLVNADGECENLELLDMLLKYRERLHPDNFVDESAREEAEEKFKEVGVLLEELRRFVEHELLEKNPNELVKFKPYNELYLLQCQFEEQRKKISELENEVNYKKIKIKELEQRLDDARKKEFEKERKSLEQIYHTKIFKWAFVGISVLIVSLLAGMDKVEELASYFARYSSFYPNAIEKTVFMVFLIMLCLVLKRYLESIIIRFKMREICTIKYVQSFVGYLLEKQGKDAEEINDFRESDAFAFISGKANWAKKILSAVGFRAFQHSTNESLSNYFLSYLLKKKLIEIGHPDNLDRKISVRSYYW